MSVLLTFKLHHWKWWRL